LINVFVVGEQQDVAKELKGVGCVMSVHMLLLLMLSSMPACRKDVCVFRTAKCAAGHRVEGRQLPIALLCRREAMRFRKELEDAQAAAAASSADNSTLRARLELAESQVAAVEAFTRKRCVRRLTCCGHNMFWTG
jgi:hypothetical protein